MLRQTRINEIIVIAFRQ